MLYPARMKKIQLLALDRYQERIVERLHELGTLQINEGADESGVLKSWEKRRENVLAFKRRAETLLDSLEPFEKIEKPQLRKLIFEKPAPFECDPKLLNQEAAQPYLSSLQRKLTNLKDRLARLEREIERTTARLKTIKKFEGFKIDLSEIRDTKQTFSIAGDVPMENLEELLQELSSFSLSLSKREGEEKALLIALGLKWEKTRVVAVLSRYGFERIIIPEVKGTPSELALEYEAKLEKLMQNNQKILAELESLAQKEINNLLALREFFENKLERVEVQQEFRRSARTFTLEGYIPERLAAKTVAEIEKVSDGYAAVMILDLDEDGQQAPVMLDNPGHIKAFQGLTKTYAMPRYDEIDPTFLMFIGFPFFFGIMLTDAAYGVMLFFLSRFIMRRFESPGIRDIGKILWLSSLWTIALGLLFGSVFGDFLQTFFNVRFGVFDVLSRADVALLLAVIVGLLHLNLGLMLGIKRKLAKRDAEGLVFEHLWIVMLEISAGLFVVYRFTGAKPILWPAALALLACTFILFRKASIFGMLEIPSFFGANLSYARLLALALATTGIALAVNIIAGLLFGSVIGAFFGILILFGGHIFNFIINAFGAFVHSMRLHYLEFFSMFYEGGGREFSPFKEKRRYTKIGGDKTW
ncbi:V-type ATP synthase subunit I [archaeon BMS3Abin16]|nr:V-type ATP synthase subunit I [archaeon BMS3Abin16]